MKLLMVAAPGENDVVLNLMKKLSLGGFTSLLAKRTSKYKRLTGARLICFLARIKFGQIIYGFG